MDEKPEKIMKHCLKEIMQCKYIIHLTLEKSKRKKNKEIKEKNTLNFRLKAKILKEL